MVGWLSGFRAQTDSVAYWLVRRLGKAAVPGGGECRPCPDFASSTLAFALQVRKITGNLVRVTEWHSAVQRRTKFIYSTWPSRTMVSTGLLPPAALGFCVRRRGQPSVSLGICRVAVLEGSQHQLNLSQSSRSSL